ncbi:hypothetical protein WKI72_01180 [Candidatus Erwinia dacicola]
MEAWNASGGSRATTLAMVFKLLQSAQKRLVYYRIRHCALDRLCRFCRIRYPAFYVHLLPRNTDRRRL